MIRNVTGGEIQEYSRLLAESREQSLQRMTARAEEKERALEDAGVTIIPSPADIGTTMTAIVGNAAS